MGGEGAMKSHILRVKNRALEGGRGRGEEEGVRAKHGSCYIAISIENVTLTTSTFSTRQQKVTRRQRVTLLQRNEAVYC